MTAESPTFDLLRSATRSAVHFESRDIYLPDDPDWRDWREGRRFHPAERWRSWFDLMKETTGRGVTVRRARVVSEPISEYIGFEYDVTADHNIAAGEQVRWLSRRDAFDLLVPAVDYWVFDESTVVLNNFDGVGNWVGEERHDDAALAVYLGSAFDAVWNRATAHEDYRPARVTG